MVRNLIGLPVPTKIMFGNGSIKHIGPKVGKYGDTVLVVCGKKSAK